MPRILAKRSVAVLLGLGLATSGCSMFSPTTPTFGPPNNKEPVLGPGPAAESAISGFIGGVAGDEPYAALTARAVLAAGGTAADAAVAAALTMTVTYPSRAGLGGGGVCLAYSPGRGRAVPEAIIFPAGAPAAAAGADRPAAVPMMARGLYLLHARHGKLPFESLIVPAEQAARSGVTASRAFVTDLNVVAGPLRGDPVAASVFLPGGRALKEGDGLVQPDLAVTLAQLRTAGVGDLYQGVLARQFAVAAQAAGGGVTVADLRAGLPQAAEPLAVSLGSNESAYFPPTEGGQAAAALFGRAGGDPAAMLAAASASGRALPASAGLTVLDRQGDAVTCAFSMNNLFGTGRIAGRTGVLLAASPKSQPAALLAVGMAINPNLRAFHAMAAGTGQEAAPLAAAVALGQAIRSGTAMPAPVPAPGRANAAVCARYLPGSQASCTWATDPRGSGIAVGSN